MSIAQTSCFKMRHQKEENCVKSIHGAFTLVVYFWLSLPLSFFLKIKTNPQTLEHARTHTLVVLSW